jgi:hypothetical protein
MFTVYWCRWCRSLREHERLMDAEHRAQKDKAANFDVQEKELENVEAQLKAELRAGEQVSLGSSHSNL